MPYDLADELHQGPLTQEWRERAIAEIKVLRLRVLDREAKISTLTANTGMEASVLENKIVELGAKLATAEAREVQAKAAMAAVALDLADALQGKADAEARAEKAEALLLEALRDLNEFPAPHRAPGDPYSIVSRISAAIAKEKPNG